MTLELVILGSALIVFAGLILNATISNHHFDKIAREHREYIEAERIRNQALSGG